MTVPGYYLLFVITKDVVPSGGRFVRISRVAANVKIITRSLFDELYYLVEPGKIEPDPISFLGSIEGINEPLSLDKDEALQQVGKIRKQVTDLFKTNKIDKTVYDNLDKAISIYMDNRSKKQ